MLDVVVVGAGVAGLAAYRHLAQADCSVQLVEARPRIGGRALTSAMPDGYYFDAGCHWLHSASENSLVGLAVQSGLTAGPDPTDWLRDTLDQHFPAARRRQFVEALNAFEARLSQSATHPEDIAASDCLEPGNPWNALINVLASCESGTALSNLSVKDMSTYRDTGENWRIVEGFGTLITSLAKSQTKAAAITTNTTVEVINHSGSELQLSTSRGTLRCHRIICTVPTSLLADEAIRFVPGLPEKQAAASGLPLGFAERVLLRLDRPDVVPEEHHVFGALDRSETGSYDLRPMGRPYIEAFFGGDLARDLALANELERFAIDELVAVFGSCFRARLTPALCTSWSRDPHTMGCYSFALPGRSHDRARLAEPVDGRLFFAGEATSERAFSTAHGAYDTGVRAARRVLQSLRAH